MAQTCRLVVATETLLWGAGGDGLVALRSKLQPLLPCPVNPYTGLSLEPRVTGFPLGAHILFRDMICLTVLCTCFFLSTLPAKAANGPQFFSVELDPTLSGQSELCPEIPDPVAIYYPYSNLSLNDTLGQDCWPASYRPPEAGPRITSASSSASRLCYLPLPKPTNWRLNVLCVQPTWTISDAILLHKLSDTI